MRLNILYYTFFNYVVEWVLDSKKYIDKIQNINTLSKEAFQACEFLRHNGEIVTIGFFDFVKLYTNISDSDSDDNLCLFKTPLVKRD